SFIRAVGDAAAAAVAVRGTDDGRGELRVGREVGKGDEERREAEDESPQRAGRGRVHEGVEELQEPVEAHARGFGAGAAWRLRGDRPGEREPEERERGAERERARRQDRK